MRFVAFLFLGVLPASAHAWEFTPGTLCLLTHETTSAAIALTYDPNRPLYTVAISRSDPWHDADYFTMHFDGPQGRRIGTDRHTLSADGLSLTVADVGFGNVLDGLQYNVSASAISGGSKVTFSLEGAAGPVAKFRACAVPAQLS